MTAPVHSRVDRESDPLRRYAASVLTLAALGAGDACTSSRRQVSEITQLTLATAEGLIRGYVRFRNGKQPSLPHEIRRAYLRWAAGQEIVLRAEVQAEASVTGWLGRQALMQARRPRGRTAREALGAARRDGPYASNTSKGAAAVPRAAPCALFDLSVLKTDDPAEAFELGATSARLTHGHPVAHAAAGAFALCVRLLADANTLEQAVAMTRAHLGRDDIGCESSARQSVSQHLQIALDRSTGGGAYGSVGDFAGWKGYTAEQALGIGVWANRSRRSLGEALALATGHGGERHATGAICGALWGAHAAATFVKATEANAFDLYAPVDQPLDLLDVAVAPRPAELAVIEAVGTDLARICRKRSQIGAADRVRWPGW